MKKKIILLFLAVDVLFICYIGINIFGKLKWNNIEGENKTSVGEVAKLDRNEEEENMEQEVIANSEDTVNTNINNNDVKIKDVSKEVLRNILFQYRNSRPAKVFLVGDFNNWEVGKDQFKVGKDYLWTITYKLSPGTYYYNYIVDGNRWILDPNNPRRANEGPSGKCSMLIVKPKKSNE